MGASESRIEQVAGRNQETAEVDRISLTASQGLVDVLSGNAPANGGAGGGGTAASHEQLQAAYQEGVNDCRRA